MMYKGLYTFTTEGFVLGVTIVLGFLLYFLFQLTLFYFFSYHIAQMSVMFVLFGGMIFAFITGKLGVNVSVPSLSKGVLALILLPANAIMYLAACRGMGDKRGWILRLAIRVEAKSAVARTD